jgi:hypothetical protein
MTDLERLFRQLVANLSAMDPSRFRAPLALREIRDTIVPYRANRRALQLESSEDYELALMCLCAGRDGYARTEPETIRAAFAEEINSPNPDLTLLQQHEHAALTLDPAQVARFVTPADPHLGFAPPQPIASQPEPPPARKQAVQDASPAAQARCGRCKANLPIGRVVNFCPECGYDLSRRQCPQCNAELDPQWRHCVSCGQVLSRG